MRGASEMGTRAANIRYPILHVECSINHEEMIEPKTAFTMNGVVESELMMPRHLSVVISAIMMAVRTWRPV